MLRLLHWRLFNMGMQEIKRKFVVPGDRIAEGNFRPLMNVIKVNNTIIATRIGIAEAGRDGIKVIPLSGVYIPRVNDIAIGDLITARIIVFDRTRDPMLTIQDKDLGKIPRGEFLKISATRVPRLIGKRGSMIQTIEQATQTRVLIGQNGIVVVTGRNPEGINLAVRAIRMVEEEAHTSNLTQRVKVLLNVPDTPQQTEGTSVTQIEKGQKVEEIQSTIQEVEEEIEEELEKGEKL